MAEQPTLGQLRLLGERADSQSAQAHSTRHLNCFVEYRESGLLTLAHGLRKARPYEKCKPTSRPLPHEQEARGERWQWLDLDLKRWFVWCGQAEHRAGNRG
jgi:hypothetical protein